MSFSHSSVGLEWLIRDVITEMMRPRQSNTRRGTPFAVAGHCDHRHAQSVFKTFGGDRVGGVLMEDRDEVGYSRQHLLADTGDEVFILEVDPHGFAAIVIGALDREFSQVPVFFDSTVWVAHFFR